MIRTIVGILVLLIAILWLPIWLQIVLFSVAVVVVPYRYYLLIPAIIADALYTSHSVWNITSHWLTLIVLAMLGLHWFIMKKMRVTAFYGLEA
jgi:hypothetical protein